MWLLSSTNLKCDGSLNFHQEATEFVLSLWENTLISSLSYKGRPWRCQDKSEAALYEQKDFSSKGRGNRRRGKKHQVR